MEALRVKRKSDEHELLIVSHFDYITADSKVESVLLYSPSLEKSFGLSVEDLVNKCELIERFIGSSSIPKFGKLLPKIILSLTGEKPILSKEVNQLVIDYSLEQEDETK